MFRLYSILYLEHVYKNNACSAKQDTSNDSVHTEEAEGPCVCVCALDEKKRD
jgi:hypothetical protein